MSAAADSLIMCTIESHAEIKRNRERFAQLTLIGYQKTTDDDDAPAALELRNCTCGSTLCVLVPNPTEPK
jgi:hypothetical protein